jgi:hypothetical protein
VNKAVPLLIILILLSTTLLLLVAFISSETKTAIPSEFLIAATIVSVVALFGATFSLYTQKRAKERMQQASLKLKR